MVELTSKTEAGASKGDTFGDQVIEFVYPSGLYSWVPYDNGVQIVTGSAVTGTARNPIIDHQTALQTIIADVGNKFTGDDVEAALAELESRLSAATALSMTPDLVSTGQPNQYTVVLNWVDADGNPQSSSDATPITFVNNQLTGQVVEAGPASTAEAPTLVIKNTVGGVELPSNEYPLPVQGVFKNPDGSLANPASADIEHNAGTVRLGAYADGNNEIAEPTGVLGREPDGTVKAVTINDLAELLGITLSPLKISGYVITGQTLSVEEYGGIGAAGDTHQWYAEGTPISGATGATYTVLPVDEGTTITLKVNGTESNSLRNFYPGDVDPVIWFDPSQSVSGELVNVGGGDDVVLDSGADQPLADYNGMPALHFKGQIYSLADQFNGQAENLTVITTLVENQRNNNSIIKFSSENSGPISSKAHMPWGTGVVYLDFQGQSDRLLTNIGTAVGQALLVSYQNTAAIKTARIFRTGDPDPASHFESTQGLNSLSDMSTGARFGVAVLDHYMLDTVICNTPLSEVARENLEGYIACKYGLQAMLHADHARKTIPA